MIRCPECTSQQVWKDGIRKIRHGDVQRYLCRHCGYRFSQPPLKEKSRQKISSSSSIDSTCQIGATPKAHGLVKNLAKVEPLKEGPAGATAKLDPLTIKGKIIEFAFWMQKQGYKKSTYTGRTRHVEMLVRRGANLLDPESVKKVIALQKTWSDGFKANMVDTYSCFLEKEGLTWNPPKYKRQEKLPFVPTETELDQLIASTGRKLSIFLQSLKETGADPGELAAITWADINKDSGTITINHPVKGHNPRIIPVSSELIRRLETLPKNKEKIFNQRHLYQNFYYRRKTIAQRLSNPRLLKITFITYRHWKGTNEYHRTKDILYVKKILGHKNINNTLIYIDLENAIFRNTSDKFTVRVAENVGEACQLVEAGFEYVTGDYRDGGKIFRKRK